LLFMSWIEHFSGCRPIILCQKRFEWLASWKFWLTLRQKVKNSNVVSKDAAGAARDFRATNDFINGRGAWMTTGMSGLWPVMVFQQQYSRLVNIWPHLYVISLETPQNTSSSQLKYQAWGKGASYTFILYWTIHLPKWSRLFIWGEGYHIELCDLCRLNNLRYLHQFICDAVPLSSKQVLMVASQYMVIYRIP
jgi:hypothetical protein